MSRSVGCLCRKIVFKSTLQAAQLALRAWLWWRRPGAEKEKVFIGTEIIQVTLIFG
jgi:hypothetical protein